MLAGVAIRDYKETIELLILEDGSDGIAHIVGEKYVLMLHCGAVL